VLYLTAQYTKRAGGMRRYTSGTMPKIGKESENMIRVFPRRTKWTPTDDLAFVGDPPLFRPSTQPVYVSVVFTWDIEEGMRLKNAWSTYYSDVRVGGPAFDDPGGEFAPGRFIKKGVTFTSRGCPFNCPWCFVPRREGKIRELEIKDGWIVQDNNLLACSKEHIKSVFDMLKRQPHPIKFSGGIDSKLFKKDHALMLNEIRLNEIWFACDDVKAIKPLEKVADLTHDISINKKRCYVLIGFDGESVEASENRLKKVYELGFLPFAQLYQGEQPIYRHPEWKKLARKWSRPAIYRSNKVLPL